MNPLLKLESVTARFKAILDNDIAVPEVAIVLGSGLASFADAIDTQTAIPYAQLEGFPVSTAPGHEGRFVIGAAAGIPVIVMQGRIHYYEGYELDDVVLPMRMLAAAGVKTFILTNACGGIQDGMTPGDLMLITDHIASFMPSVLRGENVDAWGVRFPDMTHVYDVELQDVIRRAAEAVGIDLKEGVYLQVPGPAFETPAEIRAYKSLGADVAGMSTATEAIALRHMDVKVAGISCITNLAAGMSGALLTSEEVNEMGEQVAETFAALLTEVVKTLPR